MKLGKEHHWSQEQTFLDYVDRFYMSLIPLISTNEQLVKRAYLMEDVTGLDESYPQHYGMGTSALDWTSDPLNALFFTIYSDKMPSNIKFLSVSAYKQQNLKNSPVIFKDKDDLKDNQRAIAQKGTFSYFKNPCSFFLKCGEFPSIETYQYSTDNKKFNYFEVEKISLLRTKENIMYIEKILEDNGINKASLCLNLE